MSEAPVFSVALLALRATCHLLICLRVAGYMAEGEGRHRKIVGIAAGLFAGFNFAEFIRILSNFAAYVDNVEPYLPGIMLMVLVFVVWSGGNLARFLPRKILERLP